MGLIKKSLILTCILGMAAPSLFAEDKPESSFYFGIGGGYQSTKMSISDLEDSWFPDNKCQGTGVFDFFLQYEFGKKKQYGVRLEFDFLKRGGTLNNIFNTDEFGNFYEEEGIEDISYKLRASYFDIRIPLIYQFGEARSRIRPFVYIAPMMSFATGGKINSQVDLLNGSYAGSRLDITDANMKQMYFGGAIGAGLKYDLDLYGHPFYLSLEVNYQMGFTDTYSSKEKDGSAIVKDNYFAYAYDITGNRKFNGLEVKGSLSIPLSIFSKKKSAPVIEEEPWVPVAKPVEKPVTKSLPCRSIAEIMNMIDKGEDIHGVSFCAIDDIRFDTGSARLQPYSHDYLDKVASILKRTGVNIDVKGHTDNTGTHQLNMNLSKERAMAVVKYLRDKGVPKKQLSYSYYGETMPIADNDTDEGRSINRRVEFDIK